MANPYEPTAVTAADEAAALVRFLAERDARCPRCSYNLRGIRDARCPECGLPLTLKVHAPQPDYRNWSLAVFSAALSGGCGLAALLVIGRWGWNLIPIQAQAAAIIGSAYALAAIGLTLGRRRYLMLPHDAQVIGAVACAVGPVLTFGLLLVALHR